MAGPLVVVGGLRFSLPVCLFARSSGAGIGCGTCGERTGCGGDLFGRASLRFQLGLKAGWCDLTAFFVRGHGDRRDRLYLPAVVTVHGGVAAEEVCRGDAADVDPVPDTNPDLPPLQLLDPAVERGAVSRVDAGRQCTVAGPLGVVGGGGASVCSAFSLGYYLSSHSSGAEIRLWALWCESWERRRMNTQVLCSFLVLCLCKH